MNGKFANWIALFSQTGQEIKDISAAIGRKPDMIISNCPHENITRFSHPRPFPEVEYYWLPTLGPEAKSLDILDKFAHEFDTLITLNGWLRIVPPDKCSKFNIYNGHPGLITKYPELKGKDPQQRTWDNLHKYEHIGSVVHKVVEAVDAGEVEEEESVNTANDTLASVDDVYNTLRGTSLRAWCRFLNKRLYNKV
tara:strand:+ start:750 stop:1334 length:585 start_codon:yes stop_codon:yes gene_type:complete